MKHVSLEGSGRLRWSPTQTWYDTHRHSIDTDKGTKACLFMFQCYQYFLHHHLLMKGRLQSCSFYSDKRMTWCRPGIICGLYMSNVEWVTQRKHHPKLLSSLGHFCIFQLSFSFTIRFPFISDKRSIGHQQQKTNARNKQIAGDHENNYVLLRSYRDVKQS